MAARCLSAAGRGCCRKRAALTRAILTGGRGVLHQRLAQHSIFLRNTMSYHPGKFVWFEHFSNDPGKATEFYQSLFGWKIANMPMGEQAYPLISNAERGIGGLRILQPRDAQRWLAYLSVPDVDASYQAALAAGATGRLPPQDFPTVGRGAEIVDPTGAVVALWKGSQPDPDDIENAAAGDWVWNELMVHDPQKALAFYESVFGYTHEEMDMGQQGKYYVLKGPDSNRRGGIMKAPHP